MAEYFHSKFNFQPFSMTDFFEMKSEKTWTQLNAFHDEDDNSNIFTLHNMDIKNSSDSFVEKYKAELRCLQNPVNNWRTSRPEDWTSSDVIAWLYHCADVNSIDCGIFKAEAFQEKLGRDLCFMDQRDFQELDPIYGKQIYESFQRVLHPELRCLQNPVNNWRTSRPEDWTSSDVIAWLYHCADVNSIDCSIFKAEAFQEKLGRDLCFMDQREFQELDPIYGKQIYESFQRVLHPGAELTFLNDSDRISTDNSYTDLTCVDNLKNIDLMLGNLNPVNQNKTPATDKWDSHVSTHLNYTQNHLPEKSSHINIYDSTVKDIDLMLGNLNPVNQNKTPATDEWDSHVSTHLNYTQNHLPDKSSHINIYDSTGSESAQSSTCSSSGGSSPQYCHPYNVASAPQFDCPSLLTDPIYRTIKQEEGVAVSNPTNDRSCAMVANSTVVSERKQTRGRRPGPGSKGTHLWEFIRDLLHDEKFCPALIKWEDPNMGVFRFVRSEAVAKMWGEKKNNTSMTYEKLSRAMRYYYKRGILVRVDGRRLVYKFGPRSYGWKTMCLNGKLLCTT